MPESLVLQWFSGIFFLLAYHIRTIIRYHSSYSAKFLRLVKELTDKENVTEELKSADQMLRVLKMNSIRNRTTGIVNAEIIYTV